jgi:uncharacterized membrane protein YhaH (DUF805 family)
MYIFWLLFSFNGRIGRLPYFGVALAATLSNLALARVALRLLEQINYGPIKMLPPEQAMKIALNLLGQNLLVLAVALVLSWVHLAVIAKRLHDIGKSAWWLVFLMLAPFAALALVVFVFVAKFGSAMLACYLVAGAVAIYDLRIHGQLLFRRGDDGLNDHGAPGVPPAGSGSSGGAERWDAAEAAMTAAISARRSGGPAPRHAGASGVLAAAAPRSAFGRR